MRIYIAGKWEMRAALRAVAEMLQQKGHTVTSRWLWRDEVVNRGWTNAAIDDLFDIGASDLLIADISIPSPTGGREVEIGYALGRRKTVILIGPKPLNVFHALPNTHLLLYEDWLVAIAALFGKK